MPRALRAAAVLGVAALATGAVVGPAAATPGTAPVWGDNPDVRAAAGQGYASVSWNRLDTSGAGAVTGAPDSPVTSSGYRVVALQGGVEAPGAGCQTPPVNAARMSCKVVGLTVGLPYTFKVEASNDVAAAVTATASAPVTPFGIPQPPTVTARAGYERIGVTWTTGDGKGRRITAYQVKVWRKGIARPVASRTVKGTRSTVFAGLVAGATYRATVAVITGSPTNRPVLVGPARSSSSVVPTLPPATKLPLRLGQRGPMVYTLQQRLAWAGLPVRAGMALTTLGGPSTTLFDKATQRQVKHFQEKFLLDQTGIVDSSTWSTLLRVTSSKGALPSACQGTMICISKTQKLLRYLVNGRIVKMTDVRFGPEGDPALRTRNGMHSVFSKSRWHVSSLYHTPMYYAMFFDGGQAIHYSKYFAADGYYGHSHGCVNVRDEAAVSWLFDRVSYGTPVYIYG